MISIDIQLVCMILVKILFVTPPFIVTLRKEWRSSAARITDILMGYLFLACLFTLASLRFSRDQIYLPRVCIIMTANALLCRWLSKADQQVVVYVLFLFKNLVDTAVFRASLIYAPRNLPKGNLHIVNTELAYRLLLLSVMISSAYYPFHCYLLEVMDYAHFPPTWKHPVSTSVLSFIVYYLDIGSVPAQLFLARHPNVAFFVIGWAACIYATHYVTPRIFSKLAQSHAIKEQYRTVRSLASVQTSQMTTPRYSLDQFKKVRHGYRHHPTTPKGPLGEEKADQALEHTNECLGGFEILSTVQYCSSVSSNASLNYYIKLAQGQGIDMKASILLPPSLSVSEIDSCTTLGSLLSNTVESYMRQACGPASIAINAGQVGRSIIALSVRDTYTHVTCLKGGCFMSFKRDDLGIGTLSVRYLVDRYHGILKFTYEKGISETSLLLNSPMK